jgi:hypothetical protein
VHPDPNPRIHAVYKGTGVDEVILLLLLAEYAGLMYLALQYCARIDWPSFRENKTKFGSEFGSGLLFSSVTFKTPTKTNIKKVFLRITF